MGTKPDVEELPTPQDNNEEEDPFEGMEFNSAPDVGIVDKERLAMRLVLGPSLQASK